VSRLFVIRKVKSLLYRWTEVSAHRSDIHMNANSQCTIYVASRVLRCSSSSYIRLKNECDLVTDTWARAPSLSPHVRDPESWIHSYSTVWFSERTAGQTMDVDLSICAPFYNSIVCSNQQTLVGKWFVIHKKENAS
jgi:hypothetical protein